MCNSDSDNPTESYETTNAVALNLLPEKSRQIYLKQYENFMKWCNTHNVKNFKEEVFLEYFQEKTKGLKSSTLWSTYSMLKSTIMVKNNIDISKFPKLIAFLKQQNVGYQAKKSAVFTQNDVKKFLTEAPDEKYLMWKVCMLIGLTGACRRNELRQLSINDIQDQGDMLIIKTPDTRTGKKRIFAITDDMIENICAMELIRKYLNLRSSNVRHQTFFINYRNGKCSSQVVGVHTFGKIPSLIAKYLQLPNANEYTGHSFRASSASFLMEIGSDIMMLKRYGSWKDTSSLDFPIQTNSREFEVDATSENCLPAKRIINENENEIAINIVMPKNDITFSKYKKCTFNITFNTK